MYNCYRLMLNGRVFGIFENEANAVFCMQSLQASGHPTGDFEILISYVEGGI